MNDYDRENLQFLLSASKEVLEDWYNKVGEDDHEYASELLASYGKELALVKIFHEAEDVKLTSDAETYLSKFRLDKK